VRRAEVGTMGGGAWYLAINIRSICGGGSLGRFGRWRFGGIGAGSCVAQREHLSWVGTGGSASRDGGAVVAVER